MEFLDDANTLVGSEMEIDAQLLTALQSGDIADTWTWAQATGLDHQAVVGAAKSLEAEGYVTSSSLTTEFWTLTSEAQGYVASGSPEAQIFAAVPEGDGLDDAGLEAAFAGRKDIVSIGKGKAMQRKWIAKDKAAGKYKRNVSSGCWVKGARLQAVRSYGAQQIDASNESSVRER